MDRFLEELSKSTLDKRRAHLNKTSKMDDDDPRAYEPAPGDASSKTKKSKHTKEYERRFGSIEESKEAVKNKAKETGIPYEILKQVYDRGIAAWRTSHRPGTTPHQWALARINSFATGGKTTKTADKDLHQKWKK